MSKKKIVLLIVLAVLLLCTAGIILYKIITDGMITNRKYLVVDDTKYYMKDNMYNILVLGIDKDGPIENETGNLGDNGQSDVLVVLSIDKETGEIKIIEIPRDSIVPVDESGGKGLSNYIKDEQLCLQYAYARSSAEGAELTKKTVEDLLNIDINNYVALSFGGLADIVDFVDGVDITFSHDYRIFSKIHDPSDPHWINYKAGDTQHMCGTQVLDFVQYRDTSIHYTNMERMDREKDFVNAFINKAKEYIKEDYSKATDFIPVISPYMTTDINPTQYVELISLALSAKYNMDNIIKVPGESMDWNEHDGYMIDKDELLKIILSIYYFIPEKNFLGVEVVE